MLLAGLLHWPEGQVVDRSAARDEAAAGVQEEGAALGLDPGEIGLVGGEIGLVGLLASAVAGAERGQRADRRGRLGLVPGHPGAHLVELGARWASLARGFVEPRRFEGEGVLFVAVVLNFELGLLLLLIDLDKIAGGLGVELLDGPQAILAAGLHRGAGFEERRARRGGQERRAQIVEGRHEGVVDGPRPLGDRGPGVPEEAAEQLAALPDAVGVDRGFPGIRGDRAVARDPLDLDLIEHDRRPRRRLTRGRRHRARRRQRRAVRRRHREPVRRHREPVRRHREPDARLLRRRAPAGRGRHVELERLARVKIVVKIGPLDRGHDRDRARRTGRRRGPGRGGV